MYFKADPTRGSWDTYFKSFSPTVWAVYAATINLIMGIMATIYIVATQRKLNIQDDDDSHEFDIVGSCFLVFGSLCQQGRQEPY